MIRKTIMILFFGLFISCGSKEVVITEVDMVKKIQTLSYVATAEYYIEFNISHKSIIMHDSGRKILYKIRTRVNVGVDLTHITPKDVKIQGEMITIKLKKDALRYSLDLSPQYITEKYHVAAELNKNVKRKFNEYEKLRILKKAEMKLKEKIEEEIVFSKDSLEKSKNVLKALIETMGFKMVKFTD